MNRAIEIVHDAPRARDFGKRCERMRAHRARIIRRVGAIMELPDDIDLRIQPVQRIRNALGTVRTGFAVKAGKENGVRLYAACVRRAHPAAPRRVRRSWTRPFSRPPGPCFSVLCRPCHFLLSGISLQGSDNTRSFPMQVQAARNTYMQPIRSPPELLY